MLQKIISGGQTGADRAALDAALNLNFPCGGKCPKGRAAEDGPIPDRYPLIELDSPSYPKRTRENAHDSDGTLIIYDDVLSDGTALTKTFCENMNKPFLLIDLTRTATLNALKISLDFISQEKVECLNVAGPRESNSDNIYPYTYQLISQIIISLD